MAAKNAPGKGFATPAGNCAVGGSYTATSILFDTGLSADTMVTNARRQPLLLPANHLGSHRPRAQSAGAGHGIAAIDI